MPTPVEDASIGPGPIATYESANVAPNTNSNVRARSVPASSDDVGPSSTSEANGPPSSPAMSPPSPPTSFESRTSTAPTLSIGASVPRRSRPGLRRIRRPSPDKTSRFNSSRASPGPPYTPRRIERTPVAYALHPAYAVDAVARAYSANLFDINNVRRLCIASSYDAWRVG